MNVFTFDVFVFETVYILKCQLCSPSTSLSLYTHTHTYTYRSLVLSQSAVGQQLNILKCKNMRCKNILSTNIRCKNMNVFASHVLTFENVYILKCQNLTFVNVYILRCQHMNVFTFTFDVCTLDSLHRIEILIEILAKTKLFRAKPATP